MIGPENRRGKSDQNGKLFERSEFFPFRFFSCNFRKQANRRGRLFFGYLLLAKQKKVTAPRHERDRGMRMR